MMIFAKEANCRSVMEITRIGTCFNSWTLLQHIAFSKIALTAMYFGFEGEFYVRDIEILEPSGQVMYSLITLLTLSKFA